VASCAPRSELREARTMTQFSYINNLNKLEWLPERTRTCALSINTDAGTLAAQPPEPIGARPLSHFTVRLIQREVDPRNGERILNF